MNERIAFGRRNRDGAPRAEDALRVGVLRRIAAAKLRYFGLEPLIGDVMVIVSELLTNASAPRGALLYPRLNREELEECSWV